MKLTYEATHAVPELSIEVGDIITIRPDHPENPFLVTKRLSRGALPSVLEHLAAFRCLKAEGAPYPEPVSPSRLLAAYVTHGRFPLEVVR